jgi:hypothetical protein
MVLHAAACFEQEYAHIEILGAPQPSQGSLTHKR